MKFSHNILHTYSFILSIMKHNWKIRRFWVANPLKQRKASIIALNRKLKDMRMNLIFLLRKLIFS